MEPERGREVVNAVWQEYRDWALTSRGQKKTFESARKWAIRFAITGATLATLSGQFASIESLLTVVAGWIGGGAKPDSPSAFDLSLTSKLVGVF